MANEINQEIISFVISNPNQYTYREVGQEFAVSEEQVRSVARRNRGAIFHLFNKKRVSGARGIMDTESSLIGEKAMREPTTADMTRLRQICDERNLPFEKWGIWWDKTKESSIAFYNKEVVDEVKKLHAEFLADIKKHAPKYPTVRIGKVSDPHMKLLDLADLHISKFCIGRDGNVSYDVKTATSRAHTAVEVMLTRTKGFPTERIWLPIGNDILHIDNKNATTTKGTRLEMQGLWWQAFRAAKDMYIEVIDRLAGVAPVELFHNMSNHDEHLGFCMAELLEAHYSRNKRVTFTIEPQNDRIYKTYGKNLLGFDHGDGAKLTDMPLLMACEAAEYWAMCPNRYIFRHHLHHWFKRDFLSGKDFPGVTVQSMRSPTSADTYHAKHGFVGAPQSVDAFVFHPEDGQVSHTPCVFAR